MRPAALLLAVALAGCRVPAAQPAGCENEVVSRYARIATQVGEDTIVAVTARPAEAAYATATGPAAYLRAWVAGVVEKRVLLRVLPGPRPIDPGRTTLDPAELEAFARRVSREPACPAGVRLYLDGGEALAALDAVIDGAGCRIDVLMYLWGSDEVGWHVARKLADRAGPRLPVRVLVDGGGNLAQGEPKQGGAADVNAAVCWLARQPHVTVIRTRNPAFRFDHRKLVLADGRVAWSGGRNARAESFARDRDLSYTLTGPLAAQMAAVFEESWAEQGGRPAAPLPAPEPPDEPNAVARLVRTRPTDRQIARHVYRAVELARHHVYAENPFFGDNHLLYLLGAARRRGADVRVVLSLSTDSDLFNRSNRVVANRLLAAGCRVYLYPGMTHVKALAVDGVWAYTGTGNFDNLSLRHNRELGLAISDGPAIGEMEERVFRSDFRPEWELTEPLPVGPLDYLAELIATATG